MAEILKFNLPEDGKVINSEWRDDIDVDYATYGDEKQYISPEEISSESIQKIKARKIGRLGLSLFETKNKTAA